MFTYEAQIIRIETNPSVDIDTEDNREIVIDREFVLDTLPSFLDRVDEVLNTGYCEIVSEREEVYNMFDVFKLIVTDANDEQKVFSYRIQEDEVEVETKSPLRYRHRIKLIENTTVLDTYDTENRLFSQGVNNIDYDNLYDLIKLFIESSIFLDTQDPLRDLLIPLTKYPSGEYFDGKDLEVLRAEVAPQIHLTKPTFREKINTILAYVDGTLEVDEKGFASIRYFNEIKSDYVIPKLTNKEESKSSANYCSNVVTEAKNVLVDMNGPVVSYEPSSFGLKTLRDDTGILDENSAIFRINGDKGISEIDEFICIVNTDELDLTGVVLEEGLWSTLPYTSRSDFSNTSDLFRNATFHYKIYDNKIVGFGKETKYISSTIFGPKVLSGTVWRNALQVAANQPNTTRTPGARERVIAAAQNTNFSYEDLRFRLRYKAKINNVRFKQHRNDTNENNYNSSIRVNQQDNLVDFNRLSRKHQGMAQRFGNKIIELDTFEISSLSELPEINSSCHSTTHQLFKES